MMRVTKINHLGLLVDDLDGAADGFRALGLELDRTERYGDELDIAFLPCGPTDVELLKPLTGEGMNAEDLARHGPFIQHVAFEVEDLEAALADLRERGIEPVGEAPRPGAGGTSIAFLDPARFGGILVELCQPLDGR